MAPAHAYLSLSHTIHTLVFFWKQLYWDLIDTMHCTYLNVQLEGFGHHQSKRMKDPHAPRSVRSPRNSCSRPPSLPPQAAAVLFATAALRLPFPVLCISGILWSVLFLVCLFPLRTVTVCLLRAARTSPSRFISELGSVVWPRGGWSAHLPADVQVAPSVRPLRGRPQRALVRGSV